MTSLESGGVLAMRLIEAVYQQGVFKPLSDVRLPENQRVFLNIQMPAHHDVAAWLVEVQQFQQLVSSKRGVFPDSTLDIASDQVRHE